MMHDLVKSTENLYANNGMNQLVRLLDAQYSIIHIMNEKFNWNKESFDREHDVYLLCYGVAEDIANKTGYVLYRNKDGNHKLIKMEDP